MTSSLLELLVAAKNNCVEIIWVEKMFRAEQKYRSKTISVLESTKNFGSEKDFGEGSKLWGIVH